MAAPRAATLPAQFAPSIEFARAIGNLLFRHQRAIHLARDFIKTNDAAAALRCVTEQIDGIGTVAVRFIDQQSGDLAQISVVATVTVPDIRASRVPLSAGSAPPRKLSNFEIAKLHAQMTALAATRSTAPDVPVISWRRDGQDVFFAFVLPVDVAPGAAAFSGGFEVIVNGNGTQVLSLRSLAEPASPSHAAAGTTLALVTTQRATPQPIDVYRALQYQLAIRLHTTSNDLDWLIQGDKITLISSAVAQPAAHP